MSTIPPDAPGLAESDRVIAATAIEYELALRDVYDTLRQSDDGEMWAVLREQHEAYATRIAGIAGISANTRSDDVYDEYADALVAAPSEVALQIEDAAAAAHTAWVGETTENPLAMAMASIAIMESRQATIIAMNDPDVAADDFETLFGNPALES